ncbi:MAG: tryptophan--tRNA ligase [Capsulimonas sp.]|uniref:tryptophan--tRNA ligase n=1 Tax=Capsulimonas sp. TaxID=2494211 RepID=UPI0032679F84
MTIKKRILSGMQPTGGGKLHLGNLEGALRPWTKLQDDYEMFCFITDWHSLTTVAEKRVDLREAARQTAIDYLSAGLDPAKCAIFRQSDVKEHAELHLLLSMTTPVGWLERVPTYKEKRDLIKENDTQVSYGLLGYPVLQTADIILYRAHAVPVGRDQAAHIEISREIARRFNKIVGEDIFPEPQAIISEATGEVPGLDGRKMSKSYDNAIYLSDTAKETQKKINKAFTTPTKIHMTDPGVPEGCVACKLRKTYDPANYLTQWDECRAGLRGCGQSKKELAEVINENLAPLRARRAELEADPGFVDQVLTEGAERARAAAVETMRIVRKALMIGDHG